MRQQCEEDVGSSEHSRRSVGEAHRIQNSESDIAHAVGKTFTYAGFVVLVRRYASEWDLHRGQISRTLFDQVKGCASFVDSDLVEAQCHMGQVDTTRDFHA